MARTDRVEALCGSWWDKLATATRQEHHRFAQQFLELHGWDAPTPEETRTPDGQQAALTCLLAGDTHPAIAAHFVMPGAIEPPKAVIERRLDFCRTSRVLTNQSRRLEAHYCFITDLFRFYLYDVRTEELLLHADTAAAFASEFGTVLDRTAVEEGSLEDIRRQPRSYVARQFREWAHRWYETLMTEWRAPEEMAWLAIDRLVVLRYLRERRVLRRSAWQFTEQFDRLLALAFSQEPEGCGKAFNALCSRLAQEWDGGLFASCPPLEAILDQDAVMTPLLREFTLLSRTKFGKATLLESFNYGEAAEKARVRMIPEQDEERTALLAKQTPGTVDTAQIQVDLMDEGYRAVFFWFDALLSVYDRLSREFDAAKYPHKAADEELDLFGWSEIQTARPQALTDALQHAAEKGMIVYYSSPRQYRTVRLMMYLHLIEHYQRARARFDRFPGVEKAFRPRPAMLEADRRRIYQPGFEDGWEVI